MKKDLTKSQRTFFQVAWLCVISFCFLVVSIKVYAAQQIDSSVKRAVDASRGDFISAPDGEAINSSTTETKNKTLKNQTWEPPPPPPGNFDWIQLTSGEWLKGKLKRLYERKLEFDSDKLDLQEFDWEDVKQVRCPGIFSVRFVGPISINGILQVTEKEVFVTVGDEKQVFKRDQLIAIAPGGEKEIDYWSSKISVGFNFAKGNTDQIQYRSIANVKRRTAATRFAVDYLGNLTETDSVETVNNHRIQSYFDVFRTQKYFFRPVFVEYYQDPFKNIKYRTTLGGGMGYHIIDTSKTDWEIAGGLAFQTTRFDSVEPGQDSSEWSPALIARTNFDTELTENIDFIVNYSFQILDQASGTYTHHSVTTLETELTEWLDFDISFVWDRVQNPTPDDDGIVPKKDDLYLIFSLGINF
jgi:putative salt-induced outer membrane protein YdiY